jgi:protein TIF31
LLLSLYLYSISFRGLLRDWNEEYQTCKELPKETIQERIVRDRALFKVNADFVEAAVKGARYMSIYIYMYI